MNALAQVSDADELAMVAAVLNDSDQVMAQSKVAESATSAATLVVLAEAGRTLQVRNAAKSKLNSKP